MRGQPAVIVLAAGSGSRFRGAGHKLLQPLRHASVLGSTLDHAAASGLPVIVVTTEALVEVASAHVDRARVVVVPTVGSADGLPLGMGYSIASGVSAAAHASGWLLLPADMPLVRPETLRLVGHCLAEHPVAYAQHRGRRGHPVGFAAELYSELVTLRGDDGARRIVARYPAFGVEVDDPSVLIDVDTEADLARLRGLQPEQRIPIAPL